MNYKAFFEDVLGRKIAHYELVSEVLREVRVKLSEILGRDIKPYETIEGVRREYYASKEVE